MKRTGRCSECSGTDIRTTTVSSGGGYAPDLLPGTHAWWTTGKLEVYVCCTCGYFQYFVPEEFLEEVAESDKFESISES
jgi:hypothetical protein